MKHKHIIGSMFILFFLSLPLFLFAQYQVPPPRYSSAGDTLNGEWYIFGGWVDTTGVKLAKTNQLTTSNETLDNGFWGYVAGGWSLIPNNNTPPPVAGHSLNNLNGELYCFAGRGEDYFNFLRDLIKYDHQSKTWQNTYAMGDVPNNVADHASVVSNGKLWVFGGQNKYKSGDTQVNELSNNLFNYVPGDNKWYYQSITNLPPGLFKHSMVVRNNKLYVFGGRSNQNPYSDKLYECDLASRQWREIVPAGDRPGGRYGHKAVMVGDEMRIFGGRTATEYSKQVWAFDFDSNSFTQKEDMPTPLGESVVTVKSNGTTKEVLILGGKNSDGVSKEFYKNEIQQGGYEPWYKYKTETGEWKRIGGDDTAPKYLSCSYNHNTKMLELTFDETIDVGSADAPKIDLANMETGGESFSLTPDELKPGQEDAKSIAFNLTDQHRDNISKWGMLYVGLAEGTVKDLAGNPNEAVSRRPVDQYVPDDTPPKYLSSSYNHNTKMLELTFDETIDVGSADAPKIDLANMESGGESFSLTQDELQPGQEDANIIAFNLTAQHRDTISRWGRTANKLYIELGAGAVKDLAGNPNEAMPKRPVDIWTKDTTPSELVKAEAISIEGGLGLILVLKADESLTLEGQPWGPDPTKVELANQETGGESFPLTQPELKPGQEDGLLVEFTLIDEHRDMLSRWGRTTDVLYIELGAGTVKDLAGKPNEAVSRRLVDNWTTVKDKECIPTVFTMHQNYPNQFNPETTIRFDVKERTPVVLKIYDILGREVKVLVNSVHLPGSYRIIFDARNFATGVYFYRIQMKDFMDVKKMVFLE